MSSLRTVHWQAVQTERNRVRVRLEPLPGASLDLAHARRVLDRQLARYGYLGVMEVDLEVVVRTFVDKTQQACSRLRIARMVGEF